MTAWQYVATGAVWLAALGTLCYYRHRAYHNRQEAWGTGSRNTGRAGKKQAGAGAG